MKVEIVRNSDLVDFEAKDLALCEIAILTNGVGKAESGMPVIRGPRHLLFPSIQCWGNLDGGYRCRRLLPGEKVIFTGE